MSAATPRYTVGSSAVTPQRTFPFRSLFMGVDRRGNLSSKRDRLDGRTAMNHMAVQESLDGKNVDWMEKVNDAQ